MKRIALVPGTSDFTTNLWALFNTTDGEQILVEQWGRRCDENASQGWTLTRLDGIVLGLAMSDRSTGEAGVASAGLPIPTGTWIHVAATRRNGLVSVYLNGRPVPSGRAPVSLNSTSSLELGRRGDPFDTPGSEDELSFYLNGAVDEVELYVGVALNQRQIQGIFEAGSAGRCTLRAR